MGQHGEHSEISPERGSSGNQAAEPQHHWSSGGRKALRANRLVDPLSACCLSLAAVPVLLTDRLKAVGTVNAGANAAVTQGSKQQETGSSIGLSYEFEY